MALKKNTDKKEEAKKEEPKVDTRTSAEIVADFFDEVPEKEPIVVAIAGPGGHGKTHFANTFPNPVIADTEGRAQIVMKKFGADRHRKVVSNMAEVRNTLLVMKNHLCPEFSNRSNFTFVMDSASDLLQFAETEYLAEAKKEKIFPLVLWAKVYEKPDFIFNKIRQFGFNGVFTQQLKEEYKGDKATGNWIPAGYKKIPYRVDIHLHFKKGIEYKGEIYFPEVVVAEVLKDCWNKPEATKPYLVDVSYEGIFNELKNYEHPTPGDSEPAIYKILKELEERTGIPMDKAKLDTK